MFFHNLVLHGSGPHHRDDFVRWAIDLRYERAPDPTRYADADTYYADTDGDSYGDVSDSITSCSSVSGYVTDDTDCDDDDIDVYPGADE